MPPFLCVVPRAAGRALRAPVFQLYNERGAKSKRRRKIRPRTKSAREKNCEFVNDILIISTKIFNNPSMRGSGATERRQKKASLYGLPSFFFILVRRKSRLFGGLSFQLRYYSIMPQSSRSNSRRFSFGVSHFLFPSLLVSTRMGILFDRRKYAFICVFKSSNEWKRRYR